MLEVELVTHHAQVMLEVGIGYQSTSPMGITDLEQDLKMVSL